MFKIEECKFSFNEKLTELIFHLPVLFQAPLGVCRSFQNSPENKYHSQISITYTDCLQAENGTEYPRKIYCCQEYDYDNGQHIEYCCTISQLMSNYR